jgi:hypothetical protein
MPPAASIARSSASPQPRAIDASGRSGPEVTTPELPTGATVATIEGAAPAFAPATFGDALDATLSI